MDQFCKKEKKGFIKGKYIMEAIVSLWEGLEWAKKSQQEVCFMKIDVEKAYDRVEWHFIMDSLSVASFG